MIFFVRDSPIPSTSPPLISSLLFLLAASRWNWHWHGLISPPLCGGYRIWPPDDSGARCLQNWRPDDYLGSSKSVPDLPTTWSCIQATTGWGWVRKSFPPSQKKYKLALTTWRREGEAVFFKQARTFSVWWLCCNYLINKTVRINMCVCVGLGGWSLDLNSLLPPIRVATLANNRIFFLPLPQKETSLQEGHREEVEIIIGTRRNPPPPLSLPPLPLLLLHLHFIFQWKVLWERQISSSSWKLTTIFLQSFLLRQKGERMRKAPFNFTNKGDSQEWNGSPSYYIQSLSFLLQQVWPFNVSPCCRDWWDWMEWVSECPTNQPTNIGTTRATPTAAPLVAISDRGRNVGVDPGRSEGSFFFCYFYARSRVRTTRH